MEGAADEVWSGRSVMRCPRGDDLDRVVAGYSAVVDMLDGEVALHPLASIQWRHPLCLDVLAYVRAPAEAIAAWFTHLVASFGFVTGARL